MAGGSVQVAVSLNLGGFDKIARLAADAPAKAVAKCLYLVEREAKRNHPYKDPTGTNTSRIVTDVPGATGSRLLPANAKSGAIAEQSTQLAEGNIHTESGYGGYLETGTVKMRAFPYILPAVETMRGQIESILQESIK